MTQTTSAPPATWSPPAPQAVLERVMTAAEARLELFRLIAEGQDGDEIAETRAAYVGLAVTEIATLRAELSGPQVG